MLREIVIGVFLLSFIGVMYWINKRYSIETVMCPRCGEINQVTNDSAYFQCDCGRVGRI